MSEDMRLRDFRPRTQEGYALAVRQFLDRMQRAPESLTDEDVRGYFLYLREDKKLAPSSINIAVHTRAVRAITRCRTAALGGHLAKCTRCSSSHVLYHSCRHRACPRCGHDAASRWCAQQQSLLLPVQYFHVVSASPTATAPTGRAAA
jgi:hypothetical protein